MAAGYLLGTFEDQLSSAPRQRLALALSSSSNMKIVYPWIPTFNGNILPPLNRLAPISDSNEVPTCKHYPRWIRTAVRNGAGSNPRAEAPLWETVLALWRLGQVEPCEVDDGEDNLWAQYVRAWLVSCAKPSSGSAR